MRPKVEPPFLSQFCHSERRRERSGWGSRDIDGKTECSEGEVSESNLSMIRSPRLRVRARLLCHCPKLSPAKLCDQTEVSSNQSMRRTFPFPNKFSVLATTPCRGLSRSR